MAPERPQRLGSVSASAEPLRIPQRYCRALRIRQRYRRAEEGTKADSSASPSASATAADETVASVDAEVKNRADESSASRLGEPERHRIGFCVYRCFSLCLRWEVKSEMKA